MSSVFRDNHRRADRRGVKKLIRHSLGYPNTTVGSRIRRHITLVHRVTAAEKHGIWHPRTVEVRSGRTSIFSRIDVESHNVSRIIHVIAESARDMIDAL